MNVALTSNGRFFLKNSKTPFVFIIKNIPSILKRAGKGAGK